MIQTDKEIVFSLSVVFQFWMRLYFIVEIALLLYIALR